MLYISLFYLKESLDSLEVFHLNFIMQFNLIVKIPKQYKTTYKLAMNFKSYILLNVYAVLSRTSKLNLSGMYFILLLGKL